MQRRWLCVLLTEWYNLALPSPTGYRWGHESRSLLCCGPQTQRDTPLHPYDHITAVKDSGVSISVCVLQISCQQYCYISRAYKHLDRRTCLSFMWVSLSLVTATSHTQTTVLVPAVMTVVTLGQAAHNMSPQSHKLSHTANVYKSTYIKCLEWHYIMIKSELKFNEHQLQSTSYGNV